MLNRDYSVSQRKVITFPTLKVAILPGPALSETRIQQRRNRGIYILVVLVGLVFNMTTTAKHSQLLQLSKMKLEDILTTLEDGEFEDIELCYNRISGLITKLEVSMDETTQDMLESEQSLDQIKDWSTAQKEDIKLFREARTRAKKSLSEGLEREEEEKLQRKVENQQKLNEENMKARMLEMKDRGRSNATTTARRGVVKKEISYREGSEREHGRSKCLVNLTGGQTTEVYDYSIFW